MALNLSKIIDQIVTMVDHLKANRDEAQAKIQRTADVLRSQSNNLEELAKKIETSKTTWLVARLVEPVSNYHQAQPTHQDFTVIATDGSHIDVDRNQTANCCMINIGSVLLRYGSHPDAVLDSIPHLYASDSELTLTSQGAPGREQPIEGTLLGIIRSVEECHQLAELASSLPAGSSNLGLIDGSLILWNLEPFPEFVSEILLKNGFLAYLEQIRKLNNDRQIPIASYISYPRSTDVVNALRVALCPQDVVDSDRCAECKTKECNFVDGVRDRELFAEVLSAGERSALFISPSKIQKQYGEHRVHFFYLKSDEEIARIEIPQWVAQNEVLLNLTHSLVLDQCKRGQGYPISLSEAHEKAVITGADRDNFWQVVESTMVAQHLPTSGSAKSKSKRTRWV